MNLSILPMKARNSILEMFKKYNVEVKQYIFKNDDPIPTVMRSEAVVCLIRDYNCNTTETSMALSLNKDEVIRDYNNAIITINNEIKRKEDKLELLNKTGKVKKKPGRPKGIKIKKGVNTKESKNSLLPLQPKEQNVVKTVEEAFEPFDKKFTTKKEEAAIKNATLHSSSNFLDVLFNERQLLIDKITAIDKLIETYKKIGITSIKIHD